MVNVFRTLLCDQFHLTISNILPRKEKMLSTELMKNVCMNEPSEEVKNYYQSQTALGLIPKTVLISCDAVDKMQNLYRFSIL